MDAIVELQCPVCQRRVWHSVEEVEHYDIGCCETSMVPTGREEYDDEWARWQNERAR